MTEHCWHENDRLSFANFINPYLVSHGQRLIIVGQLSSLFNFWYIELRERSTLLSTQIRSFRLIFIDSKAPMVLYIHLFHDEFVFVVSFNL